MNNKKYIKIISITIAIIFFIGILLSTIGYIGMKSKYVDQKQDQFTNVSEKSFKNIHEEIIEIKKSINLLLKNTNKNNFDLKNIHNLAQKYTYLGDVYKKENKNKNNAESKKAYKNAIMYYQSLINNNKDYKIISSYEIIELKEKLDYIKEGEILLNNLLNNEKNYTIKMIICFAYGVHLKKDLQNSNKSKIFFNKALSLARSNKDKKMIKNYMKKIF